jgi:stage V sporulation protein D (sporulation-specific penicillin-binding protein)
MGLAMKVGKEKYYGYLNALKVSQKTGIDLPGEVGGSIHSIQNVTGSTIATASFGQGFTLTQLNMINVLSTIANDGIMMQPRIVKEIRNSKGEVVQTIEPIRVKQVFLSYKYSKILL